MLAEWREPPGEEPDGSRHSAKKLERPKRASEFQRRTSVLRLQFFPPFNVRVAGLTVT